MIDWEKMPYTQEEFKNAWRQATLVNDVCRELGVPETTGTMRTIKRTAKDLDLPDKYVWTRDFSPADFTEAWSASLTPQEAAKKLGAANTRSFEAMRVALNLSPKEHKSFTCTQEEFLAIYEKSDSLDEIADQLSLSGSGKSFKTILGIIRSLGLEELPRRVYTTETGEDASAIIANWIDWYKEYMGTLPLDTHVRVLAKRVKELIKANYPTVSINYGLWQWSLSALKGYTGYNVFESEAQKHFLKNSPVHQERVQALVNHDQKTNKPAITDQRSQRLEIEEKKW